MTAEYSTDNHASVIHGQGCQWQGGHFSRQRADYWLSDCRDWLDVRMIHRFLSKESHWAQAIPLAVVERSLQHSLCFGLYAVHSSPMANGTTMKSQIGFARVVTDCATFAYFCDVFVLTEHRGQGLSSWMMEQILEHPALQGLRKYSLVTSHARRVYQRVGFQHLEFPERWLEIHHPDLYRKGPRSVSLDVTI